MNFRIFSSIVSILSVAVISLPRNNVSAFPPLQSQNSPNQPQITAQTTVRPNRIIVPGKSVGQITKRTKRADLAKLFPSSRFKDEQVLFFGGEVEMPGTKVTIGKNEIIVLWTNKSRNQAAGVMILDPTWQTPEGVGVGTTLAKLRQLAGREFKMTGFGWDYGGIPQLRNTKLKYDNLTIQMTFSETASQKYPQQVQKVSGDHELLSNNPNLRNLDVRIFRIIAMFE
ncbi:hypothetical protein [Calothrix sp. NIES-3974]|uniref:hypothetical protein n=1 Tax=Calothrix sp. NIES-3974 TaxID=2005462 RepID=UPI000B5F1391|nr:hypothetical protein [Calothrix sp. NIES-3974]BAZ05473.1 hypothetical protein NIES3974_21210 [Calothrix sp. NIES-3974]